MSDDGYFLQAWRLHVVILPGGRNDPPTCDGIYLSHDAARARVETRWRRPLQESRDAAGTTLSDAGSRLMVARVEPVVVLSRLKPTAELLRGMSACEVAGDPLQRLLRQVEETGSVTADAIDAWREAGRPGLASMPRSPAEVEAWWQTALENAG